MLLSKEEIVQVLERLKSQNPNPKSELEYSNAFTLLVAVVLSAQATDKSVNIATKELFQIADTPEKMLELGEEKLIGYIKSIGLYRNKAKNIIGLSKMLLQEFAGEVPDSLENLVKLPGVGRKTANVVLSNAFGVDAIAVDTHVFRVSNRIGLVKTETPEKTEFELMKVLPKKRWSHAHHLIIFHGRRICKARKPECNICPLIKYCDYYQEGNVQ